MLVMFLTAKGIVDMIKDGKAYKQTGLPRVYRASQERLQSDVNKINVSSLD